MSVELIKFNNAQRNDIHKTIQNWTQNSAEETYHSACKIFTGLMGRVPHNTHVAIVSTQGDDLKKMAHGFALYSVSERSSWWCFSNKTITVIHFSGFLSDPANHFNSNSESEGALPQPPNQMILLKLAEQYRHADFQMTCKKEEVGYWEQRGFRAISYKGNLVDLQA